MDELLYEVQDGIAYTTLNRPQARNALTYAMYAGLADICARAAADPQVKVMVLRGAGDQAFASGTDISQFSEFSSAASAFAYEQKVSACIEALETFPKPLIAAVNGACAGGGLGIASTCDLRLASATARIGLPIARTLGNCIGRSTMVRMSSIIGAARMIELIFTARMVAAVQAREMGFFNEVVETPPQLAVRTRELAAQVAQLAPLTLRASKEQVRRLRAAQVDSLNYDDLTEMCFTSRDFKHAVESFIARRPPVWEGR